MRTANPHMAERSATLPAGLSFKGVGELRVFLGSLAGELESGCLTQIGSPLLTVHQLLATDAWPDVIECEFADNKGRRYRLFVDTYHGTGGDWKQVD